MCQHIIVKDYNPLWVNKYEEESLLIKDILADNCIAIYHIGSTSVEGLAAKTIMILWWRSEALKRWMIPQVTFQK